MPGSFSARFAILFLDSLWFSPTLLYIELRFRNTHPYASNESASFSCTRVALTVARIGGA